MEQEEGRGWVWRGHMEQEESSGWVWRGHMEQMEGGGWVWRGHRTPDTLLRALLLARHTPASPFCS